MQLGDLFEARSNPDKNIRENALTALAKYAGQKDIFVSFTSGFDTLPKDINNKVRAKGGQNKIGMNPRSSFDTPLGIYTYPVDYILEYSREHGKLGAPYTGSAPWRYLYILRRNTNDYLDSASQTGATVNKLHDLATTMFDIDTADQIMGEAISTARDRGNPQSMMWNLARLVAERSVNTGAFGKTAPVAWNVIMRKIGCNMYSDDKGAGIIHPNEPTQAVFFTAQAFKVVDTIEKANDPARNHDWEIEDIVKEIKKRRLNVTAIDPIMFRHLLAHNPTPDDLTWIAGKMGVIQKRIVNETLTEWPYGLAFGEESLNALRRFGPVPPKTVISIGTSSPDHPLTEWPKWMGRKLTNGEWRKVFEGYGLNHGHSFVNRLIAGAEAPFIDQKFIINALSTDRIKFETIISVCDHNNVPLNGDLVREVFTLFPQETLTAYPNIDWSFKDWYRASRRLNHMTGGLGVIIPLDYAIPILMRSDERSTFTPDKELLKRLIAERPDFMKMWFPKYGGSVWTTNLPELTDFVTENAGVMALQNPDFLRFFRFDKDAPVDRLIVTAIWKDLSRNKKTTQRTVEWALDLGWITQEDFKKHLTPSIAGLVQSWSTWWDEIDPELLVDAYVMLLLTDRIYGRYLKLLAQRHPEEALHWQGRINSGDAEEVYREFPAMRGNKSVLGGLDSTALLNLITDGFPVYDAADEPTQARIIAGLLAKQPEETGQKLISEESPFWPYPDAKYWTDGIPYHTVRAAISRQQLPDDLAAVLIRAYNAVNFAGLDASVSHAFMQGFARLNINAVVTLKLFANPIPQDMLEKFQIQFLDKGSANWRHRHVPAQDLHDVIAMLLAKMVGGPTLAAEQHAKTLLTQAQ